MAILISIISLAISIAALLIVTKNNKEKVCCLDAELNEQIKRNKDSISQIQKVVQIKK